MTRHEVIERVDIGEIIREYEREELPRLREENLRLRQRVDELERITTGGSTEKEESAETVFGQESTKSEIGQLLLDDINLMDIYPNVGMRYREIQKEWEEVNNQHPQLKKLEDESIDAEGHGSIERISKAERKIINFLDSEIRKLTRTDELASKKTISLLEAIIHKREVTFEKFEEEGYPRDAVKEFLGQFRDLHIKLDEYKKKSKLDFDNQNSTTPFTKSAFLFDIGTEYPYGLSIYKNKIYVINPFFNRLVRILDINGNKVGRCVINSTDDCKFCAGGIAIAGGKVYITDKYHHQVNKFDLNESHHPELDTLKSLRPFQPYTIIDEGYTIVGGEFQTKHISVLKAGGGGSNNLQFRSPHGIAIYKDRVYVVDTDNFRVQILDLNLGYISQFGRKGREMGEFINPYGISVHEEMVFVADNALQRIQVFDLDGRCISQSPFDYPYGIAVCDGRIYIADTEHNKIRVFKPEKINAPHEVLSH